MSTDLHQLGGVTVAEVAKTVARRAWIAALRRHRVTELTNSDVRDAAHDFEEWWRTQIS